DDKDDVEKLLAKGRAALRSGNIDEALALANQAVERAPKEARAYLTRGMVRSATRKPTEAIADFDRCLELDPKMADAYQQRGGEYFKLAKIDKSIADFDRLLEMRPDERPGHWQRGIALYYAGKFREGAEQFKAGDKVFGDDVENAVWHYLCNAKVLGAGKARAELLKIGTDKRIPMMVIYDLFTGKATPADVTAAVEKGKPNGPDLKNRSFYANLYLGLYYDAAGESKKAREHLEKAGDDPAVGGYMGDVARVHLKLMRKD
ncbi:MAG TPA: tetratricopeptide repeat protein, partial [Gemmataceae bacterium]|nr:tetratricopeptide repeat protein [Gemmataceae bacterium]